MPLPLHRRRAPALSACGACLFVLVAFTFAAGNARLPADDTPAELSATPANDEVLVTVNGQHVSVADLKLHCLSRRIPAELEESMRERLIEQLVDERLLASFLAERKAEPDPAELERQLQLIRQVVARQADDADAELKRLGYTEESLRRQLALPLAWKSHVERIVTDQQIRDFFADHRPEFDGTRVRARQIVIAVSSESDEAAWQAATDALTAIRDRVMAKELTFDAAARQHSTSPSRSTGGELGWIDARGKLPAAVAVAALALEPGEVSPPIRSPFGVHLVMVEERMPGDLSLEDVRPDVWKRLSQELWEQQVRTERERARIEWPPTRGVVP